jgi:hypothetical protein
MRSLDEARNVCERYHPGMCAALADISLAEREAPGGPVLDIFRKFGGPGLMVPTEYGGMGWVRSTRHASCGRWRRIRRRWVPRPPCITTRWRRFSRSHDVPGG